ncbi:MAG: porin [Armatimonadetes bacterium]|nr:porin [Armatimonadota bacterium]
MKLKVWLSTGTMAILAMAATAGWAQEETKQDPPATETAQPADPANEQPADQTSDSEEKEAPVKRNEFSIGYTSSRGNVNLKQHARIPEGFGIHNFRLLAPGTEGRAWAKFIGRGFPRQDNVLQGLAILNNGHTVIRGIRTEYGFYTKDWRTKGLSERRDVDYTIDQSIAPGIGAFAKYHSFDRQNRYPAPRDGDHTRNEVLAVGVGGKVLEGNLNLAVASRRTSDVTGAQPKTLQKQYTASYSHDLGDVMSLEGSFGYARIEQSGLASSNIKTYALGGNIDMGPSTGLQFHLGRTDYDFNNIQNAYIRKRLVTSARLMHHFNKWSVQLGYKHQETERVRKDHTFVDVPKYNEFDARLAGKLGPARLTIRGSYQDLLRSAVVQTQDTRQMIWDDKAMLQTKLDGGNDKVQVYAAHTYRFHQNRQRGVEMRWNNLAFGGSFIATPQVSLFGEVAFDNFKVQGSDSGQYLDFYFPNARNAALGFNYTKDATLGGSASLNYYSSGDVSGTQLTLSVYKQLGEDHKVELLIAPWRQTDKLYGITGYRATILSARYTVRF